MRGEAMGFFERIFGRKVTPAQQTGQAFEMLTGYVPAFRTWNGSVMESELIRASLDAHGRNAAKLQPVLRGSAKPNLQNRLRIQPNVWQTWPTFLYQTAVNLYARNTAFIVPVLGEYDETDGIACISPNEWKLIDYQGEPWLRFYFDKRRTSAIELQRVGILTRYQYKSELFGEDNEALRATLDLIAIQRQGVQESIKNGASYRFYATSNNWTTDDDLAKERKRFDRENFQGAGGAVLLFPNTYKDVKQITPQSYTVDAEEQKLIKENVFDYFAVNEDVLQNKAYGDKWLAFYEGATEWFALNISETITKMLYTERERSGYGNGIFFSSNRIQYMSNADKLNFVQSMADRGAITRNEMREVFNLSPLPEPYGSQIPARGEYYNVNATNETGGADDEQAGNSGV